MGAYSNPETVIDTQSGQHIRNLQQQIASSFAGVAQNYSAKQTDIKEKLLANKKILDANDLKATQAGFELYQEMGSANKNSPSVNFAETYEPLIQEYVELNKQLLNGTSEDSQYAMKRMASIKASPQKAQDIIVDMGSASQSIEKTKAFGVGNAGGLSSSNKREVLSSFNVLNGTLTKDARKRFYYENNDPDKLMLEVSGVDAEGPFSQTFNQDQLKKITDGAGLIRVIPNQAENFDVLRNANSNIFETKDTGNGKVLPTGQIAAEFLGKEIKVAIDGQTVDAYGKVIKNMSAIKRVIDKELIKKDVNFTTTINAQSEALLSDEQGAKMFYNEVMADEKGTWPGFKHGYSMDKAMTPEDKAEFKKDYLEYFVQTQIPQDQFIKKVDSDVAITTTKVSTPETGTTKTSTSAATKEAESVALSVRRYNKLGKDKKGSFKSPGGHTITYSNKYKTVGYYTDPTNRQGWTEVTKEDIASKLQ